jgi:autoinducer 2-degrading protein
MIIVHVFVHVKPDFLEAFKTATIENASHSVKEPGVARFDVIQETEDATRFTLIEIYRDDNAPALHKKTAHYLKWRDTVAGMMAESRSSKKYINVFPQKDW